MFLASAMCYQLHVEKVKEYLETVKDFDELISPQSLFLHFLGPELSTKIRRDLEVVKKSKRSFSFGFFFFFLTFSLSFQEWQLGLVSKS